MARYTGPRLKKARAYGVSPQAIGLNKESKKDPNEGRRRKVSEYGMQLNEKQKAKFIYGVNEKQFRKMFDRAEKMDGPSGLNLISLLELRLDNVVYRLGFASTRQQARQMVVHGHFRVNGQKVDIPSYTVQVGDEISVKDKSRSNGFFKDMGENKWNTVGWVNVDSENYKGKVEAVPTKDDLDYEIEEHLIVELYSK